MDVLESQQVETAAGNVNQELENLAWNVLHSSHYSTLENQGIIYSPELSRTVKRHTFHLRDYPGHLFFPYDSQWN